MKASLLLLLMSLVFSAHALDEDCDQMNGKDEFASFVADLSQINDSMYKKVLDLEVNHDGKGDLSVFYDQHGIPQILKLSYKNKGGEMNKVLTFKDLADGESLWYENDDVKGKAIIVEKAEPFVSGKAYQFQVKVRSSLDPDRFTSHVVKFNADAKSHSVANNNRTFRKMVLSPGISFFSWDGTFKKVDFK
jgi:hypothetical protein